MHSTETLIRLNIALAVVAGFLTTAAGVAAVGQEQVLFAFNNRDGVRPIAGVIFDAEGNLYGTTVGGGGNQCDCGTVFKLSPAANGKWSPTVLHRFSGKDGSRPYAGLVIDAIGNLYGTTAQGGSSASPCNSTCGVVFKLSPGANGKWTETVLHDFNLKDGASPYAALIFHGADLYGTTAQGGSSASPCNSTCGVVFKLSPGANGKWTETVLHSFNGKDGANPYAGVIFDSSGNLYGTTYSSSDGESTVFKLTPSAKGKWTHTVVHTFNGKDGNSLIGGVIFDAEGNLYGATPSGGAYGWGTVFKLSPAANGKWKETVLHNFNNNGKDGTSPSAALIFDTSGNLYGTSGGGEHFAGAVFELQPNLKETLVYSFNAKDGAGPSAALIFDASGNLYSTTSGGGEHGDGTVFRIKP